MTDREACIALNLISGIGYVKFTALCDEFGSPAAALDAPEAALRRVRGVGGQLAGRIANFAPETLEAELELAERCGVRIISLHDGAYPDVLRNLYDPPLVLYVRGTLPSFPDRAVAVVGSRRMSNYGARMARSVAADAAGSGYAVVSGLAYGVDTVAHRAAVDASGVTVAVLGAGLMHIHPRENVPLAREIVERGGALVSEFPLDFPVARNNFPRRNRIVAGLCRATLVIEAGLESGALITARMALENGREVFAMPGHADNPQAAGCHRLIKEGAGLIENFGDVLESFGVGLLPGFAPGDPLSDDPLSDLSPELRLVFDALAPGDATLETLQERTGLATGELLAALMRLELKLLVECTPERFYRRLA